MLLVHRSRGGGLSKINAFLSPKRLWNSSFVVEAAMFRFRRFLQGLSDDGRPISRSSLPSGFSVAALVQRVAGRIGER